MQCLKLGTAPEYEPVPAIADAMPAADDGWWCCRHCGARVAPLAAEFRMVELPQVFANPHGHFFELVTLRDALGVAGFGQETEEHTWFAGYAWQAVMCQQCWSHLGWRFRAARGEHAPSVFWGLIRAELTKQRAGPGAGSES